MFKHLDAWFLLYLQVLPTIVKLFASNDRAIRVGLLQHIDQFGESLSTQIVDEQVCIFHHVLFSKSSFLSDF